MASKAARTIKDAEVLDEAFRTVGAVVLGKRMFDVAQGGATTSSAWRPASSWSERGSSIRPA